MTPWQEMLGKTREEVVALLGEPQHKGATSRKYPTPSCYQYGNMELHFQPWKTGTCVFVFDLENHHDGLKWG